MRRILRVKQKDPSLKKLYGVQFNSILTFQLASNTILIFN